MASLYRPTPGGFPGNDDGGQMSAWWVFGALGLSPSVPGSGVLTLSGPLFPHVRLTLAHGTLDITAPLAAPSRPYVLGARLDGRPVTRTALSWDDLARGHHTLAVGLSGSPRHAWGTGAGAAPPSYGGAAACQAP
jgi:putative alpha-1,2-mannosidase